MKRQGKFPLMATQRKETRTCDWCDEEFKIRADVEQRYCSIWCHEVHREQIDRQT